ncbi:hypothetical protein KUCAC02_002886, partial [Chaenocephalus aceratus]
IRASEWLFPQSTCKALTNFLSYNGYIDTSCRGPQPKSGIRQPPISIEGTPIPTVSEKPVKSLGKMFNCILKDTTSVQTTGQELEGWLTV